MSHMIAINDFAVRDLDLLEAAAKRHAGKLERDVNRAITTYQHGVTAEHVLSFEGATYEIGVNRKKNGEGFDLAWDPYDHTLVATVGQGATKLRQSYALEATKREMRRRGHRDIRETVQQDGSIRLRVGV